MKVYKFKCLNCKKESQCEKAMAVFEEGCPLCNSKRIKVLGYAKEITALTGNSNSPHVSGEDGKARVSSASPGDAKITALTGSEGKGK